MLKFTLTKKHLLLLRHANVRWQSAPYCAGAPEISPKRPYGNQDFIADIHLLLTGSAAEATPQQSARYLKLHRETEMALQVVLQTGSFAPGKYVRPAIWDHWRPAE
jgi:hypothetical protein